MTGQYAQQQKILLYVLPLVFAVGGIAFPIGVLIYWTTSNLWTMGQQFYVIRNNPAPGHAGRQGQGGARRRRSASARGCRDPSDPDRAGRPTPTDRGARAAAAPAAEEADPQPAQEEAAGSRSPGASPASRASRTTTRGREQPTAPPTDADDA